MICDAGFISYLKEKKGWIMVVLQGLEIVQLYNVCS